MQWLSALGFDSRSIPWLGSYGGLWLRHWEEGEI
jgi:hypothetical protein